MASDLWKPVGVEYPVNVADCFIRFGSQAVYHIDEQGVAESTDQTLEQVQCDRVKTWTNHNTTETQLYHRWLSRNVNHRERLASNNLMLHDLVGEAPGTWNLITASPWIEPAYYDMKGVINTRQKSLKMPSEDTPHPFVKVHFLNFDLDFGEPSGYVRITSDNETHEISWEKDGKTILMTDFDGNMVRINRDRTVSELFASPADLVFTKYKHELSSLKDADEYKSWNESMFRAATVIGLQNLSLDKVVSPADQETIDKFRLPDTLLDFRNTTLMLGSTNIVH